MPDTLSPVITIDESKCVSCHACISVCPVKYCMDGSGDTIRIDHDKCIGCGRCIRACTHGARSPGDDFSLFMETLSEKQKIVAVAAPATASVFPGEYLRLNGWLVSLGVSAVFDVSFGAELTVESYRHHIETVRPRTVVSQPCPAVVSYIELYRPELLPHLAPYDSPMLHTIKMIRKYYPEYRNHRIAVLSPCVAKRREFDETGHGDFNVTLLSLKNHLRETSVKLTGFREIAYAGPAPERAVLFSSPGGLLRTYMRENPDILPAARRIEGADTLYSYLETLPEAIGRDTAPLLVDCLNCEKGCNGGPGTGNADRHLDELERPVEERAARHEKADRAGLFGSGRRKLAKRIAGHWDEKTYSRTYRDMSTSTRLKTPTDEEFKAIYRLMLKDKESDFLNCTACGYASCRGMAVAIHNGLNKPENCHQYQKMRIEQVNVRLTETGINLDGQIRDAVSSIGRMKSFMENVNHTCDEQFAAIEESSASIAQMMESIRKVSGVSTERGGAVVELKGYAESGKIDLDKAVRAVQGISTSVGQVGDVVQMIEDIASRTNLLSINASIEAAHAGSSGKGFIVVATEIRKLAESAGKNSKDIADRLDHITSDIRGTVEISTHMGESIGAIIERINSVATGFSSIVETLTELSAGSDQVLTALHELSALASSFRGAFTDMVDSVDSMHTAMERIAEISKQGTEYREA